MRSDRPAAVPGVARPTGDHIGHGRRA